LEAAERRAFHGYGVGIERVDLDDPAEAIGLVWLPCQIEAVEIVTPIVPASGNAHAAVVARLAMVVIELAGEIAVDVLLAGQPGAPGRASTSAVVEHAKHFPAAGIG